MSTFYANYPSASATANPSVGTNGLTAPTSSTEVGGINPSGNLQPLQTDASGNLLVDIASPIVLTENIAQFGGNPVVTGTGASGLGIPRVTVSNDSTVGLNAGTNNIGSITNVTGAVSLPTGAATAANQATEISSLSTIAINTTSDYATISTITGIFNVPLTVSGVSSAVATLSLIGGTFDAGIQFQGSLDSGVTYFNLLTQSGGFSNPYTTAPVTVQGLVKIMPVAGMTTIQAVGLGISGAVSLHLRATKGVNDVEAIQLNPANFNATVIGNAAAGSGASTGLVTIQGNASGTPIPVSGTVTITPSGEQNVNLNQVGGSAIAIGQQLSAASLPVVLPATQITALTPPTTVTVTQATGTNLHAVIDSSALPTGAATSALQSNVQSAVGTSATTAITVQGSASGAALPISAASLPLPVGAATSANQTSGGQKTQLVDTSNNTIVSLADGNGGFAIEVAQAATSFQLSTGNSSVVQLAAGASFTGTIDAIVNQQSYSILLTSDQPGTLTLKQYIDAAGTHLAQSITFTIAAGVGFSRSGVLNGNYAQLIFHNTGASATTTFDLNTYYGTIPASTQLNNAPIALNEVNGTALSLGQTTASNSIPVVLASGTPVPSSVSGTASANAPVYNVYSSTNITTATYVQLVASTTNAMNTVHIFDSSGQAMILATGASGSEVIQMYVPPGGDTFTLQIAAGTRIAYKALTANATAGYLLMSFLQ